MNKSKNVFPGYFDLTPDQRRFRTMLLGYPKLLRFWNFSSCHCDIAGLQSSWGRLSSEEQQMASFFVSMWQPENVLNFDIMDALTSLDDDNWHVIQTWMASLEQPRIYQRMMSQAP